MRDELKEEIYPIICDIAKANRLVRYVDGIGINKEAYEKAGIPVPPSDLSVCSRDRHDFYEVSVRGVKRALEEAFEAGMKYRRKSKKT